MACFVLMVSREKKAGTAGVARLVEGKRWNGDRFIVP